jgi:dethiobiotin synthetase
MQPIFITGIGTGVGKTLVAAIVAEALGANYWKPVQAGYAEGTDSEWVGRMIGGRVYPEVYRLALAASPHIAAREEGVQIDLDLIAAKMPVKASPDDASRPVENGLRPLVIEGAGGLLVPLNQNEFVVDLVKKLDATVVVVSRNYLGSINHSLLTASVCKAYGLRVAGWIFNDQYLDYEREIINWTRIPAIAAIPRAGEGAGADDAAFVRHQARRIRPMLEKFFLFFLPVMAMLAGQAVAQPPAVHYAHPPFSNSWYPNHVPIPGHSPTVSQKHHFRIMFADGKDTVVYTKIIADSPAEYLLLEHTTVGKKDPGRFTKVFPSQTQFISHVNVISGQDYIGLAGDSCWLFKVIEGKINAYTAMAEISVDDEFLLYLQAGDGPLVPIGDPKAPDLFSGNADASNLFLGKKYSKAIKKYNSAKD